MMRGSAVRTNVVEGCNLLLLLLLFSLPLFLYFCLYIYYLPNGLSLQGINDSYGCSFFFSFPFISVSFLCLLLFLSYPLSSSLFSYCLVWLSLSFVSLWFPSPFFSLSPFSISSVCMLCTYLGINWSVDNPHNRFRIYHLFVPSAHISVCILIHWKASLV